MRKRTVSHASRPAPRALRRGPPQDASRPTPVGPLAALGLLGLVATLILLLGHAPVVAGEEPRDEDPVRAATASGLAAMAEPDDPAWQRGKALFHDTQDLFYPSCAHCHNLEPAEREAEEARHLGPGPTLFGSALRAGWRNRTDYADVAEASQPCAKSWQERKRGLTEEQRSDLLVFLKSFVPEDTAGLPARKVERKPPLLEELGGGDPARGAELVERHCTGCHQPGEEALSFELEPGRKRGDLIARKVRGYDARGRFKPDGSMSYYTTERLSDARLRDVIAHLGR